MKVLWILALTASVASALRFDNQCPPEQEDNWEIEMLLAHEDCDKFYKCTFGQPVVQQCPAELYFNLELWQCDWKENVDCTDRNVPGETPPPTSPPTTRPTTAPTTRPTTAPTTRPTTAPTTRPTTAPTTRPTTAPTTRPTTAPTTRPTTAPTTRPTTAPTTRPTPAPTPAPTPDPDFLENGCPVSGMVHWLLPHEKDCNLFYYCVWGQKVLRQCPSSLHFNRVIQVCDWPNRAGCLTSCNKHAEGRRAIAREV